MAKDSQPYIEIGERLRALRFALGYGNNQKGFAELVGIASNAWNNYERGRRQPELDKVAIIRAATGVTRDWVYEGSVNGLPVDLLRKLSEAEIPPQAASSTRNQRRPRAR